MIWPFKRKPKHVGPTSVDWKPGDVAECILPQGVNWLTRPGDNGPKRGEKLLVTGVEYGPIYRTNDVCFALSFVGYRSAYCCEDFRKINLTDTGADRKVGKWKPVGVDA